MFNEDQQVEDKQALAREVVPRTLQSLFVLRITLCITAAVLAVVKISLSPPSAAFVIDLLTNTPSEHETLSTWMNAANLIISGLLACGLALIVATFLIHARLLAFVAGEPEPGKERPVKGLRILLRTLKGEVAVALVTGLVAFGIGELLLPHAHVLPGMELLVPRSHVLAATFGLVAGAIAGALDTLYFHLLFLLREAPLHAAESRYVHGIEDARRRLADGSIRLREALIRRFEADYQRTAAAARVDGRSGRQLREAKRRRAVRFWVVEEVIPGSQLTAASASAKTDHELLEKWTDYVDALVDARMQFQRRQPFAARFFNRFRPGYVAEQMLKDLEAAKGKG